MKHLDEGSLHAWLDRDRSGMDPERSTEIERHLRECEVCVARLREAEALTGRAASILGSVDPEDAEIPPFTEVLERAGLSVPDRSSPRSGRRWLPLAWAASVAGAVGLGWWTNDLMRVDQVAFRALPVELANESAGEPPSGAEPFADEAAPPTGQPEPAAIAEAEAPPTNERARDPATARADLATSFEVAADERSAVVQGRVTDDTGRPIASAQVFAPDADIGVLTDQDGNYSLSLEAGGDRRDQDVSVTAQRLGYREMTREIALGPGDTISADFPLEETTLQLDEVIVTGVDDPVAGFSAWAPVSPVEAEATVGFAPLAVPGWEVVSIELAEGDGSSAVRVLQTDERGTALIVIQRQGAVDVRDQLESSESTTVTISRDGLIVTGTAPVPADSLRMLLERAR